MEFIPSYINLFASGELCERVHKAQALLDPCTVCPRKCGTHRLKEETGECQIGYNARVYSYMPHHGEENVLRGRSGSGTIFLSGCNLHCQYCQNFDISQTNRGLTIDDEQFAATMLILQAQGCHNINFVSPSHVIPQILRALEIAIPAGLRIPLVYNSGGYDALKTLQLLDGIIDIYLPDMKYSQDTIAEQYSRVENYAVVNRAAIQEMHRQVGDLACDQDGIAYRGLLVRHLLLPNDLAGTRDTCEFLAKNISVTTHINIMGQYRPDYLAFDYPELSRPPTRNEIDEARKVASDSGLTLI